MRNNARTLRSAVGAGGGDLRGAGACGLQRDPRSAAGRAEQGRGGRRRQFRRQRRQHRVADRRHPAQPRRFGRLQHPRHRLRQGRQLQERDRRLHQSGADRSEVQRRLHQSRARFSPDGQGRPGARRLQRRHRRQSERRVGLSRPRQSAPVAEPSAGGDGRPRRGDPPQSRRRAGLPRARPDLSAPRQQRTGDHRLQQRHRPRPVRRRALSGARPESAGDRQVRSGGRRLRRGAQRRFEQRRSLGGIGARLREARQQGRRRSSPTSARPWSRRAIPPPRPGCSGWARPELSRGGASAAVSDFRSGLLGNEGASLAATRRPSQCAIAGEVVTSLSAPR